MPQLSSSCPTATNLDAPDPSLQSTALYVAAETSLSNTNGTFNTAQLCLPNLKHETVKGGHFDFLQTSAIEIAEHARNFFLESTERGYPEIPPP